MLYASLAGTFILSEEAVANSPTRLAGVSDQLEAQLRLYGCELIQEAGCLLKLPQAVMATGQVLLHRFYGKRSMTEHDVKASFLSEAVLLRTSTRPQAAGVACRMWRAPPCSWPPSWRSSRSGRATW